MTTWTHRDGIRWILLALLAWAPGVMATTVAEVQERGELVMLAFPHQQSVFVRVNLEAGTMPRYGGPDRFEGIDVDIMTLFADELGVKLMIRPVRKPNYRGLIPDLLAGRGDVIASSFSIIPARRRKVAFSDPYYSVNPVVVAKVGSSLEKLEDLRDLTAVVVAGSSNQAKLRQLKIPLKKITTVGFMVEAFEKILDGDADFTMLESAIDRQNIGLEPDLEVAFHLPDKDDYGYAVVKGSDLLGRLNELLARIRDSGQLGEIIERHFEAPSAP